MHHFLWRIIAIDVVNMRGIEQLDLNLLFYLDVLLDEKHISKAAKRLHLSQPALSNALRRMRESLGDALLVRAGNDMELTPFARHIQTPLKEILHKLEQILKTRTFDPWEDEFSFQLGFHGYEELFLLPRLIREFSQYPRVSLCNRVPKTMHIVDDLCKGTVHFTTTPLIEERAEIMRLLLFEDEFVSVVHNDAEQISLDIDRYCQSSHLLITPNGGAGFADQALKKINRHRYIKITTGEFSNAPFVLAQDNSLMATVPRRLAQSWLERFPLRIVPCPVSLDPLAIYLSWHRSMQSYSHMNWFKQRCLAHARD